MVTPPRKMLRERLLSTDDDSLPRSPINQPINQSISPSNNHSVRPSRASSISSLADGERDPLTPSFGPSFNQPIAQSLTPLSQSRSGSFDQSVGQGLAPGRMIRSTSAPYNQSNNPSINQTIDSIDEKYFYSPNNLSFNHATSQPINQAISPRRRTADSAIFSQAINHSLNQPINQIPVKDYRSLQIDVRGRKRSKSINQTHNQSLNQSYSGQTTPRSDISPSVELSSPTNQALSQSFNQSGNPSKRRSSSNASPYFPRAYSNQSSYQTYQSINPSINQSTFQLNDDTIDDDEQSVYLSVNQPSGQPVTHSRLRSPSFRPIHPKHIHSITQSNGQSINQSINQFGNPTLSRRKSKYVRAEGRKWWHFGSIKQTDQFTNQSLNQSIYQSKDKIIRQSWKHAIKQSIKQSIKLLFFFVFFLLLVFLFYFLFLQFRTVALYNNQVCRAINHQAINQTIDDQSVDRSDIQIHLSTHAGQYQSVDQSTYQPINQTIHVGPTNQTQSFSDIFFYFFSSIFGIFSLIFYSVFSILGAMSPRIRIPSVYQSINQTFTPDYSHSPLLDLPINFFRVGGSHNSYHLPSSFPLPPHQYGHAPLFVQLGDETDGVRSLELDIHLLPGEGGSILYHLQMIDDHTNCYCLVECLQVIKLWLQKYNQDRQSIIPSNNQTITHIPITFPLYIFIEIKRELYEDFGVGLTGITCNDLYNLDIAIRSVFGPDEYLLPKQIRGAFPSVSSALRYQNFWQRLTNHFNNTSPSSRPTAAEIAEMEPYARYANASGGEGGYGWPRLGDMLGKVLFTWLDDVHNYADRLPCINADPSSEHALMFIAQAHANRSYSALQISRNPILDFVPPLVKEALRHGMMLRTLSTTASFKGLHRDYYYAAVEAGIHIISTDFEPPCLGNVRSVNATSGAWIDWNEDERWCERLPSGWPFECHPVLAPSWCEVELRRIRQPAVDAAINRTNVDPDADQANRHLLQERDEFRSDVDKYAPSKPLVKLFKHANYNEQSIDQQQPIDQNEPLDPQSPNALPVEISSELSDPSQRQKSNRAFKKQHPIKYVSKSINDPSNKQSSSHSAPKATDQNSASDDTETNETPIVTIQLH